MFIVLTFYTVKLLWGHTRDKTKQIRGEHLMESTPIRVVLTVPPIWTESTCGRMRQAVERAGILEDQLAGKTTLEFISELEAAAMFALYWELRERGDVKNGSRILALDLGGEHLKSPGLLSSNQTFSRWYGGKLLDLFWISVQKGGSNPDTGCHRL